MLQADCRHGWDLMANPGTVHLMLKGLSIEFAFIAMNIKVDNREKTLWRLLTALKDDYGLQLTLDKKPLDIGVAIIENGEE